MITAKKKHNNIITNCVLTRQQLLTFFFIVPANYVKQIGKILISFYVNLII